MRRVAHRVMRKSVAHTKPVHLLGREPNNAAGRIVAGAEDIEDTPIPVSASPLPENQRCNSHSPLFPMDISVVHELLEKRRELLGLPIEGVDFLCAGVPKQKRRIVGSHPEPDIPKASLAKVLQIGHPLQLAVANAHSHH